jgi:small redox-active disulfide protein 2
MQNVPLNKRGVFFVQKIIRISQKYEISAYLCRDIFAITRFIPASIKMIIKILGTGCPKCKTLFQNVQEAVQQLGISAEITKIEDIMEIMNYDIMSTPALVVDEVIKFKGRIATVEELKIILQTK